MFHLHLEGTMSANWQSSSCFHLPVLDLGGCQQCGNAEKHICLYFLFSSWAERREEVAKQKQTLQIILNFNAVVEDNLCRARFTMAGNEPTLSPLIRKWAKSWLNKQTATCFNKQESNWFINLTSRRENNWGSRQWINSNISLQDLCSLFKIDFYHPFAAQSSSYKIKWSK